ncbi:MAG TPA: hypothetical protein DEG71_06720, partial [Clostridiales bacterium]|nr:hypothetical protein [Clostridiales bacterium]
MEPKKLAMVIGIAVLLPLFLVFFVDALYTEPKWEKYCNSSTYSAPYKEPPSNVKCDDFYLSPEAKQCTDAGGNPITKYNEANCPVFDKCDYCQKDFNTAQQLYNRNIFFILCPLG